MGERERIFDSLGLRVALSGASYGDQWFASSGDWIEVHSPTTGELLAKVEQASKADYNTVVGEAMTAFEFWRALPAPKRGEIVRQIGVALRQKKDVLGRLVSLEMGKIMSEGLGEVQEMIDVCDYAVGLSRTLSGPTLQSERPMHRMMEQWHPLGAIGVITAFNFPVAVCLGTARWLLSAAIRWCGSLRARHPYALSRARTSPARCSGPMVFQRECPVWSSDAGRPSAKGFWPTAGSL